MIFDKDMDYPQDYSHGFIDKAAKLPCDFCERGVGKFKNMWSDSLIKPFKGEVMETLVDKCRVGNPNYILPPSLMNILDNPS